MRDLERYQRDYAQLPFEDVQSRYRRRKVSEILSSLNARRILEVGCGTETLCLSFTQFDVMHIVEPVARFAAAARAATAGRPGVQVHEGTLEETVPALRAGRFDCIVLSSLLHEVEQPRELLRAIADLCGAATVLHVNVPNARSLHRRLGVQLGLLGSVHDRTATQQRMQQQASFDADSLSALVTEAGFETFASGAYFLKPFAHAQMAELLGQGVISERLLEALYTLGEQLPEHASELWVNARRR
jgi:2-polyprenyl-3-methyl-5-hydroxy-6-metoxy-1,4-benzoquinol methylase